MAYIDTRNGGEVTKLSNGKFVRKGTKQPVASAHVSTAPRPTAPQPAVQPRAAAPQQPPATPSQPAATAQPQAAAPATPPRPANTAPIGANGQVAAASQPAIAAAPAQAQGGMPPWAWGLIAASVAIILLVGGGIAVYRLVPTEGAATASAAAEVRDGNGMLQRITITDPRGQPFSCWGVKPATRRVTVGGKTGMELYCP